MLLTVSLGLLGGDVEVVSGDCFEALPVERVVAIVRFVEIREDFIPGVVELRREIC